jgi:hypothetical protein
MNYLRAGVRIPLELPAEVRWKSRAGEPRQVQGKTSWISANGMFVSLPVPLRHHTPVTITISLPVEVTKIPLQLCCRGRVVSQPPKRAGIGAIIDDYRFRPARQLV